MSSVFVSDCQHLKLFLFAWSKLNLYHVDVGSDVAQLLPQYWVVAGLLLLQYLHNTLLLSVAVPLVFLCQTSCTFGASGSCAASKRTLGRPGFIVTIHPSQPTLVVMSFRQPLVPRQVATTYAGHCQNSIPMGHFQFVAPIKLRDEIYLVLCFDLFSKILYMNTKNFRNS